MSNNTYLPTENESWGFYGTMGGRAYEAWPIAMRIISEETGHSQERTRDLLDSRLGRHFADAVNDFLRAGSPTMEMAIEATFFNWTKHINKHI